VILLWEFQHAHGPEHPRTDCKVLAKGLESMLKTFNLDKKKIWIFRFTQLNAEELACEVQCCEITATIILPHESFPGVLTLI
jgi:hypothetical protein